jgi:hypothetical protein
MTAGVSPYPMIYVPLGVTPPSHLAPGNIIGIREGKGIGGTEGVLYGTQPELIGSPLWQRTAEGWWILFQGQQPQQLRRMDTSPRILTWTPVDGANRGEVWLVPRLLKLIDPEREDLGYVSALDRIYAGEGQWRGEPALARLQEQLLSIAHHVQLAPTPDERNGLILRLVIDLAAIGHYVSLAEMIAAAWLSELVQLRFIFAALGRDEFLASVRPPRMPAAALVGADS